MMSAAVNPYTHILNKPIIPLALQHNKLKMTRLCRPPSLSVVCLLLCTTYLKPNMRNGIRVAGGEVHGPQNPQS